MSVNKRTRLFQNIALLVFGAVVSVCLVEVFLRSSFNLERRRGRYNVTRNVFSYDRNNMLFDSTLGYAIRPGLEVDFRNEEFINKVSTNSRGFRDDEASITNPDVIFLGDSFGFGWGVEKAETCEAVLENMTGVKMLNMGVPGYATVQEFLQLKKWASSNNLKGKTIVFLLYYNDLTENLGDEFNFYPVIKSYKRPLEFSRPLARDYLRWISACNNTMYHGLSKVSYFAYVSTPLMRKIKRELAHVLPGHQKTRAPSKTTRSRNDIREAFSLLAQEISAFVEEQGARVIFVYIPSILYYENKPENDSHAYNDISFGLSGAHIPLIDMRTLLSHNDYYTLDCHLKASGHRKLADAIMRHVRY